jgi:diguanylate cyclase (GGDEF)-like protein
MPAMKLRLKTRNDVWLFALAVSAAAALGSLGLRFLFLPPDLFLRTALPGTVVVLILAAPIAVVVGGRLRRAEGLTAQLEHALSHDPLTGLGTRARFHARVAALPPGPKVLAVADIDHFKAVNDRYGHPAGDSALWQVAQALRRNCRQGDVVARFGGEEFVILLQDVTPLQGYRAAARLCRRIREEPVVLDGQPVRITVSFGLAPLEGPDGIETAMRRADRALYRAKADGRDRACAYQPGVDDGPQPPAPAQPLPINRESNG